MFKRFQSTKAPPPYPPIEEDIRCPQCGFNHAGWAFEPGYAKLCVKCGTRLEASGDTECSGAQNAEEAGFFERLFKRKAGRKAGALPREEPAREPEENAPELEPCREYPAERVEPPETTDKGPWQILQTESEEASRNEEEEREAPLEPREEPPDPEAAQVGACKRQGRLFAAQGRYEEAIEMLDRVIAFEPNDLEAWGELGRIHYKGTGDLAKSIHCSRRALEIDEDLVWVKCNLCLALLFDDQFDLAKKGFLEVIRSVRNSRGLDEEFQANCKALLHDCLGELYVSKKEALGERLDHIKELIELLEIEKIYFH